MTSACSCAWPARFARSSSTTANPAITSATATTAVAATVVRVRSEPRMSATVPGQPIPRAADRGDRLATERRIEFAAECADVDLDDVRVAVVRGIPDVVEDLRL